jgi:nicotinamide-nucleotide adenylyltransferase
MVETGVIHGRFQILHNDHMKYLLAGKAKCRHIVVGITNPDPSLTREDPADPLRSLPLANPLTYFERYLMVQAALLEAELTSAEFSIVPFPINLPELYRHYVPMDSTFFLTLYDEWGERKLQHFRNLGLKIDILWKKPRDQKGLTSTEIREKMLRQEPWERLVPTSTAVLMKQWGIPSRLRKMLPAGT